MLERPTAGRLRLAGRDVAEADTAERKAFRRTVQMVFQNPFASLNPRKKIGQALEEPLAINTKLSAAERAERGAGRCWPGWASGRSTMRAIRTCSPAGSGSASRSPGR
jgi:ABC-type microcin C transport system duplicated ATPase subunit YejF